ncbi:GNAT family N-acetyltransferase [Moritella sp. 24]|uniref:GNAT family N-acetyltransferase n=1 Tax=Moritella sp. 24 TaxID=2746230 RepID=UPI001BA997A4|nr:GNAT family N-acetyltransferase [Moritella sp. 24]QUM76716.1 GNAT family N-acetyltransferase [Moritella sp. 24]
MDISSTPRQEDLNKISRAVREHNLEFMPNDFCDLAVLERDSSENIIAGLTATTYWDRLDIAYLWVSPEYRGNGLSKKLLLAAEKEAINRGCRFSQLDTFDFQALGLYLKLGYKEYGKLSGYNNGYKRFYLQKELSGT